MLTQHCWSTVICFGLGHLPFPLRFCFCIHYVLLVYATRFRLLPVLFSAATAAAPASFDRHDHMLALAGCVFDMILVLPPETFGFWPGNVSLTSPETCAFWPGTFSGQVLGSVLCFVCLVALCYLMGLCAFALLLALASRCVGVANSHAVGRQF